MVGASRVEALSVDWASCEFRVPAPPAFVCSRPRESDRSLRCWAHGPSVPRAHGPSAPAHGPSVPQAHGPSVPRALGPPAPAHGPSVLWLPGRQCLTQKAVPNGKVGHPSYLRCFFAWQLVRSRLQLGLRACATRRRSSCAHVSRRRLAATDCRGGRGPASRPGACLPGPAGSFVSGLEIPCDSDFKFMRLRGRLARPWRTACGFR